MKLELSVIFYLFDIKYELKTKLSYFVPSLFFSIITRFFEKLCTIIKTFLISNVPPNKFAFTHMLGRCNDAHHYIIYIYSTFG